MLDQKCRDTFASGDLIAMHAFVEKLIRDGNHDDLDAYKKSPLMYACKFGNIALVKILLNSGVDVNKLSVDGESAVTHAIYNSNRGYGAEIIVSLLKHDANIDEDISINNEYPLLIAAKLDNHQCFKLLLPHSAWCSNYIDKRGCSAISYANQNNCKEELDKFLFHAKGKKSIQYTGAPPLGFTILLFTLIKDVAIFCLIKLGFLELQPVGILKNGNVSFDSVRVTFNVPQQHDAEFKRFVQDMKSHVEATCKKLEAIVYHRKDTLIKLKKVVALLQDTPDKSEAIMAQLKAAEAEKEAANESYVCYNEKLSNFVDYDELCHDFKKRFANYKFDNNYDYPKTLFFELCEKYIKDVKSIQGKLDVAFNSIELSELENVNFASQPAALQFSHPLKLKPTSTTNDLGALSERINKLSLRKMQFN